jgi:dihydropteroate synthase
LHRRCSAGPVSSPRDHWRDRPLREMIPRDGPHDEQTPPAADAARWRLRDVELDLSTPRIMAICNVTPDSFSDGGEHYSVALALKFAEDASRDGASILDVGGESTRPGATPVHVERELARVIPVIEAVRDRVPQLLISIDTVKSAVAQAALDAGAHIINDVSAGRIDGQMFGVASRTGAGLVLMHSRGGVRDMASYAHAEYGDDVVGTVCAEVTERMALARSAGVAADQLVIDPGLGFSKTSAQSIALLRALQRFVELGRPVLVGVSRKRFIGEITGVTVPALRATGSAMAHAIAVSRGARVVRTHDVAATREAIAIVAAL